jgi:hypothetical protein
VDALGYPLAVLVSGADVSDTEAGKTLADRVATKLTDWSTRYQVPSRLALVRADGGYKTSFVDHVTQTYQWVVDIAQKPESMKGFVPQAGRWQVERSYAEFSTPIEPGLRENRRIFGGYAPFSLHFFPFAQSSHMKFPNDLLMCWSVWCKVLMAMAVGWKSPFSFVRYTSCVCFTAFSRQSCFSVSAN